MYLFSYSASLTVHPVDLIVVVYNLPKFNVFQIFLSTLVGPYLLYQTLDYWVYPMKDYIGETGCHMVVFYRNAGILILQIQSLCTAIFRYICLFRSCSIWKFNFSPYVSIKAKILNHLLWVLFS